MIMLNLETNSIVLYDDSIDHNHTCSCLTLTVGGYGAGGRGVGPGGLVPGGVGHGGLGIGGLGAGMKIKPTHTFFCIIQTFFHLNIIN